MKRRAIGAAMLAVLFLLSCVPGHVDTRAEARAVRDLSQRWLAAEVAKDVPKIVEFYAEDAVEWPSNTPPIRGRDAIRKWYESWLLPEGIGMTFATDSVDVAASGDLALERGTYRFTQHSPRGSTEDVGKYVTLWKRVGRDWKVALDMANSDRPCPSPP